VRALDDIIVLSCEQFGGGTTCTELLAFLGAEVIMVEPPGTGQPRRQIGSTQPGADSFHHIYLNLNKKSITLNLKHPDGVKIFKEMAKVVDIVHDNLGPGAMDRLGLGYDELKKINPRLIVGTVKGFGDGPYGDYLCHAPLADALSGAYTLTGWPDKPPNQPGAYMGETNTGMHGFVALLAALHQRDITGEGQFVEVSIADSSLFCNRGALAMRQAEKDPLFEGEPAKRWGNAMPGVAPHGLYKTVDSSQTDNYLAIHVENQAQWAALLKVIGRAELIGDERFKDSASRWQRRDVVDKLVEGWTSDKNAYDAFHALAQAGVPAGVTQNSTQVMNDPHLMARESVIELEHPVRGKFKTLGCAPRLADSPVEIKCAPLLGQHNEEIYTRLLGYQKDDLTKLAEEGII